ncbi:hypothetical protein [Catellatospora vulcania]|uniref:hypothetical protein n=1 Tax=Catellatospora vulcania TaxID=1460450 RepID=UPI0012D4BE8B|nr:hypothetical protein [Catellatospora vulcania]
MHRYAAAGDTAAASDRAEQAGRCTNGEVRGSAAVWLGPHLLRSGRPEEAERCARQAVHDADEYDVDTLWALIAACLRAQGRAAEADAVLAEHGLHGWDLEFGDEDG